MNATTLWFGMTAILLLLEYLARTGQILILALACAAGGSAALLDCGIFLQSVAAIAVTAVGWVVLYRTAAGKRRREGIDRFHNVASDDGERVHIAEWAKTGDTQVEYQGRIWSVRLAPGHRHRRGDYRVVSVETSHLVLQPWGMRAVPLQSNASESGVNQ